METDLPTKLYRFTSEGVTGFDRRIDGSSLGWDGRNWKLVQDFDASTMTDANWRAIGVERADLEAAIDLHDCFRVPGRAEAH